MGVAGGAVQRGLRVENDVQRNVATKGAEPALIANGFQKVGPLQAGEKPGRHAAAEIDAARRQKHQCDVTNDIAQHAHEQIECRGADRRRAAEAGPHDGRCRVICGRKFSFKCLRDRETAGRRKIRVDVGDAGARGDALDADVAETRLKEFQQRAFVCRAWRKRNVSPSVGSAR